MSSGLNPDDFGKVVRVEYDYSYKANDGRIIEITEGKMYVLIKKSNEDWWQVVDEGQKKPIYIPAAYVRELSESKHLDHPFFKKAYNALMKSMKKETVDKKDENLHKPRTTLQRLSDGPSLKERMIVVAGSREDLSVLSGFSHTSKFSEMRASTDSLDKFIENENPYDIVPLEPLQRPEETNTQSLSGLKVPAREMQNDEDPDYENLVDFISLSESYKLQTVHDNIVTGTQIEPKRGSRDKKPPEVSKKPSLHRPDLADNATPVYTNLQGKSAIRPAMPDHHSPQSSTTVEVLEDGWGLQLDNQTGNKYYYNPATGMMRLKPPRKSNESSKSHKPNVEENTSPEPLPRSHNKTQPSEKRALRPSPLQRRKTSPARFKNPKKAPFMKRTGDDDENISPNENNSNNFLTPIVPVPTENKEILEDSSAWSSPLMQRGEHQSPYSRESSATSRSLSPDASITDIMHSPTEPSPNTPAGWINERNADGETILVNAINGDRWIQFFDPISGSFYYCNELTRVTVWELPLVENSPSNSDKEQTQTSETRESSTKHGRSSSGTLGSPSAIKDTKLSSIRKSKTLDRDSYVHANDSEFGDQKSKSSSLPWPKKKAAKLPPTPPSANLKPRKGRLNDKKNLSKRMLHSQSMIILDDNTHHNMYSMSYQQKDKVNQSEVTRDVSAERRSVLVPPPHPMIERQGRLNWTKLAEAGKKTKKNWIQQWVVLLSSNLLFYKDQKQAMMTRLNPLGKPESSCELRGACVEWAKDKSSKKNVFEVSTVRGFCFLLQHDDVITIGEWYKSTEAAIKRANQGDPLDHGLMVRKDSHGSTEDESMDNNHLDVKDKKKKDKDKKKDKKGKPPSRHGSDAKQSDKVRSKLRKFISKRPTMESLQERGLIKETVFGCPLYKLCEKEGTTVPKFVRMCVQEVETRGLKVDGIYRVSGNLSHVQKLRYMVDREIPVDLSTTEWEDIHVITGALKMFLRELPEPVIPFTFFDKFIATCKITSANSRLETTKSLIRALPTPNKETLKYLMQHFCRVVEKKECNRMQVQNVAIVFGPTLLLNPPETTNHYDPGGGHMAVYLMYQNQIIDYMLTEYKSLF